jgi:hypothetical protein
MNATSTITVTFFLNPYAKSKREVQITAGELLGLILNITAKTKERLPLLKLARFGDELSDRGCIRHDDNMLAISGIEGDYDAKQVSFEEAVRRVTAAGIYAIVYTSPSHRPTAPKWRVLAFCSREYPPSERDRFMGRLNGVLMGVLAPESWTASQSFFYGKVRQAPDHRAQVIVGDCIDLRDDLEAGALQPVQREAQAALKAARAMQSARPAAPRVGDDASLIEKIRARLDLHQILASHGYDQRGDVWRHPNSQSGSYGLNIKSFSGITRVYSHNGTDPLHPGNLPAWTAGVTALDVVDVVAILDFAGDRTRCLRELAQRFGVASETPRSAPFVQLWDAATRLLGTAGDRYLSSLGLAHLVNSPALRFIASCPHPDGPRLPALIAAVHTLDGELAAALRTYLRTDGRGVADGERQRAAVGHVMGAAIQLSPINDVVGADELVIGTDLEEAAALGALMGCPAWAAGITQNMAGKNGIKLPPEVRRVVIATGRDEGAARSAWFRLRREGRDARIATPPGEAGSYVDVLKNKSMGRHAA